VELVFNGSPLPTTWPTEQGPRLPVFLTYEVTSDDDVSQSFLSNLILYCLGLMIWHDYACWCPFILALACLSELKIALVACNETVSLVIICSIVSVVC